MARLVLALTVVVALLLPASALAAPPEHKVKATQITKRQQTLPARVGLRRSSLSGASATPAVPTAQAGDQIFCNMVEELSGTEFHDAFTGEFLDAQLTIAGPTVCPSSPVGVTQTCQNFLRFPAPSTAFAANVANVSATPVCTNVLFTRTGPAPGEYDALYFTQFFAPPGFFWSGGVPAGCIPSDPFLD